MNASTAQATLPPGPPGLPLLGHLAQVSSNPLGFFYALARTYGPVVGYRLGPQQAVLLTHPEGIREVLVEHAKDLTVAEFNHIIRPVVRDGLFTKDGLEHRRLRRLMQPAFSASRVERYRDTMVAHTERMLATWVPGSTMDMAPAMRRLTLGIIAETVCGVERFDEADLLGAAITNAFQLSKHRMAAIAFLVVEQAASKALQSVLPQPHEPGALLESLCRSAVARIPHTPLYRLTVARDTTDTVVGTVIRQRRAASVDRGDVLSTIMAARDDDGTAFSDQEVQDQLVTLLAAGYGTTASILAWTFYLLSQNSSAESRLREELGRVLAGRPPSAADLEQLPYLDHVWNEALRLYPPGWYMSRFCHEDIEVAGYRLRAGTMLTLSAYVTQRLPEIFRHPNCFMPERFDPASGEKHHQYAFLPFGAGPRTCLGAAFATLEGKVLLATIIQRYVLQLVPGHPVYPEPSGVLRPAHGMPMILHSVA